MAGWQYRELLAALLAKQAGVGTEDDAARGARAYAGLTAFLRLHPEELPTVRAQIVGNSPLANTLIAALRDAGTPETQQLLAELLDDTRAADRRARIARGLSLVEQPTARTVATLQALETDDVLGVQATYGLGSALYRLRTTDPVLAATIADHLRGQLAQATTVARVVALLGALGNAGHPGTLDVIERYLVDANDGIRAAAAGALRRIPGPRADELLGAATRDGSAAVRAAAVEALARRPTSNLLALAIAELLRGEPEFLVRARAVHTAASWLPAAPLLTTPLELVAQSDPSADLRRIAAAALP